MGRPLLTWLIVTAGIFIIAGSDTASAQVPEASTVPRTAVPARETIVAPESLAEPVATPVSQTPGQPTATVPAVAPAPAPAGVTPLPPAAPATTSTTSSPTTTRSYSAAVIGLTLDGINAGVLKKVEGGAALAEVVVEPVGPTNISKKHIAAVKYENLSFDVGFDSKTILDWIASTWKGTPARKNGVLQIADYNYDVRAERQFSQALLIGTTFPALDAASKEPAFLKVTIAPELVRDAAGSGKIQLGASKSSKLWLPSNFRLEMDGLDASRVSRIAPLTVGQTVGESAVGELREYEKSAGGLTFSDLKVTMPESSGASWAKWHHDFVISGMNGDAQEKNGAIVFLDPTRTIELGRVSLFNCGIYRYGAEPVASNLDTISRVTANLYCERMELIVQK
jgi:hypothetical protein